MTEREVLPDKMYFSIGEVARFFGVSTSLIRYWEDEFPQITPRKNGKGDRRYTKSDVEKVARIYELIKEKGFTIRGAQAHLAAGHKTPEPVIEKPKTEEEESVRQQLIRVRSFLIQLKEELSQL
jgi:DNA-binding transcriptional MerR regulator